MHPTPHPRNCGGINLVVTALAWIISPLCGSPFHFEEWFWLFFFRGTNSFPWKIHLCHQFPVSSHGPCLNNGVHCKSSMDSSPCHSCFGTWPSVTLRNLGATHVARDSWEGSVESSWEGHTSIHSSFDETGHMIIQATRSMELPPPCDEGKCGKIWWPALTATHRLLLSRFNWSTLQRNIHTPSTERVRLVWAGHPPSSTLPGPLDPPPDIVATSSVHLLMSLCTYSEATFQNPLYNFIMKQPYSILTAWILFPRLWFSLQELTFQLKINVLVHSEGLLPHRFPSFMLKIHSRPVAEYPST